MKKILVILMMVLCCLNIYAYAWKNGSIVYDNEDTRYVKYYEGLSGYVGLYKYEPNGEYIGIVLKTSKSTFDLDYKTKVIIYDINNNEVESFYLYSLGYHYHNAYSKKGTYKYLLGEDKIMKYLLTNKGYVRFISELYSGTMNIKIPCIKNTQNNVTKKSRKKKR